MIKKFNINITPFNLERTIHLYLPDDYDDTDERYPVMYMYDGHNLFYDEDATYGKSWGLKQFLDHYDKKFIIVGIECNHQGNERLNEFCPYDCHGSFLGDITGKGQLLMDWVVDELKPYVDQHYRTLTTRECTGIGGSSMGGLMSVYTILHYNDTFSKAACLSSSILLCFKELKKEFETHNINPDTHVYFGYGQKEIRSKIGLSRVIDQHSTLMNLLEEHGAKTLFNFTTGYHCEAAWEKENPVYFDFLWKH